MGDSLLSDRGSATARALLLAERIDTRPLELNQAVATAPVTLLLDQGGICILFLQTRRAWRVEVAVLTLIGIEIALSLSDLILRY